MEHLLYCIAFVFFYIFGWVMHHAATSFKKPDGLLNVDTRDPDKDFYDFVFLIPTVDIPKRKFLKIEVKTKS